VTPTTEARFGYVPYSSSLTPPGDRRRFVNWARSRNVRFELVRPGSQVDLVVLSARADISLWASHPHDGTRIVYDLIDSYLAVPAWRPHDIARGVGKTLLRQHARLTPSYTRAVIAMCRRADAVVCSTPEQAAELRRYCADVRVILDVHDDELAPAPRARPEPDRLRLFWEGLPENLTGFRPVMFDALRQLRQQVDVSLDVVTAPRFRRWFGRLGWTDTTALLRACPIPATLHEWDLATLPGVAASCDVAVIPLDLRDDFAAGKPENKLLIMWQLGLPTVTAATPAYRRTMQAAGVDWTCTSTDDWVHALLRLGDPAVRSASAAAGAAYVARHHTGEQIRARWDQLFTDLLNRPPRRG
jgi:glycosyltransferase involved in cell wall biosynthesis